MRLKNILTNHSIVHTLTTITMMLILIFNINFIQNVDAEPFYWDESWNYFQEIEIPFDTNIETAIYQPIDIKIEFDNLCWAKNENEHSVRVVCWDGFEWHELECQIYNLEKSNNDYINSCGLVFLIPDFADGSERYFVYYSDSVKDNPNYIDHVQIEESYYHYEPISGYALESSYYKITNDGYCTYLVSQEGQFMGYNTGQHITKMVENTTEVKPKNGGPIASFDFKYSYGEGLFDYSSTSQKMISKEIVTDGNLMIEFGMISRSKLDDLQTTVNYKYYYCPSYDKTRIHVHVIHEALEDISLNKDIILDTNTDGTYANLQTQYVKSRTIDDLNFGLIFPYMHYLDELNSVSELDVDTDPEYIPEDLDIRIISITDDVDLGNKGWISFDEGESGVSHSIIFYSDDVVKSGFNERNGFQINAFEMDYPHLPGLENNMANIVVSRNSYEKNGNLDTEIPQGLIVEFDAEYFSNKNNGYTIINDEAEIFRILIDNKPENELNFNNNNENKEKHNLSINIHQARSMPMGSALSALFGRNFSYISAELYRLNEYVSSESAVRLPMKQMDDFDNSRIFLTILKSFRYFDWRNLSFYKKIVFSDIEEGKYLVKVFRENPLFSDDRQYIGYSIVNLDDDAKIDINCRKEGKINLNLIDQNDNSVENAQVLLKDGDSIIAESVTDQNGECIIKAPKNTNDYKLEVIYKGSLVYEENVNINLLSNLKTNYKFISIDRYNINLVIYDTWDLSPGIELNPIITTSSNSNQFNINFNKISNSNFNLSNLPKGDYKIILRYKSVILEESVNLNQDANLVIQFPAEFKINMKIRDSRGLLIQDPNVYLEREGRKINVEEENNKLETLIPPGEYLIEVNKDENIIYKNSINIFGETNIDVVTNNISIIDIFSIGMIIILTCIVIAYSFIKKDLIISLKLLPVVFVLTSILFPWWMIQGSSNQVSTTSSMYLAPVNLITIATSSDYIVGELAYMPDLFIQIVNIFILTSIVGCILIFIGLYFEKVKNQRISLSFLISGLIVFFISLVMFLFALNEFSSITVGSIIGEGYIDYTLIQNEISNSILSTWSFGIGFYIYLLSVFLLLFGIVYIIKFNKGEERTWFLKKRKSMRK